MRYQKCGTRRSHSTTKVSPFILLQVTRYVLCSENPEIWDHWDHPPARTALNPRHSLKKRSACIRTWFSGSSVLLAPAGEVPFRVLSIRRIAMFAASNAWICFTLWSRDFHASALDAPVKATLRRLKLFS